MSSYIYWFEVIGVIAFAISGALEGIKFRMDFLGVIILGIVTATGGGIMRDVILGNNPPLSLKSGYFIYISISASIVVFVFSFFSNKLTRKEFRKLFEDSLVISDAIGLSTFTVTGMQVAYSMNTEYSAFLYIFLGVLTGVGGGVVRDLLTNQVPYIMERNVYASASIVGAIFLHIATKYSDLHVEVIMTITFIIILGIRLLAHKFKWNLPKATQLLN